MTLNLQRSWTCWWLLRAKYFGLPGIYQLKPMYLPGPSVGSLGLMRFWFSQFAKMTSHNAVMSQKLDCPNRSDDRPKPWMYSKFQPKQCVGNQALWLHSIVWCLMDEFITTFEQAWVYSQQAQRATDHGNEVRRTRGTGLNFLHSGYWPRFQRLGAECNWATDRWDGWMKEFNVTFAWVR